MGTSHCRGDMRLGDIASLPLGFATYGPLSGLGGFEESDPLPCPSRKSFRRREEELSVSWTCSDTSSTLKCPPVGKAPHTNTHFELDPQISKHHITVIHNEKKSSPNTFSRSKSTGKERIVWHVAARKTKVKNSRGFTTIWNAFSNKCFQTTLALWTHHLFFWMVLAHQWCVKNNLEKDFQRQVQN